METCPWKHDGDAEGQSLSREPSPGCGPDVATAAGRTPAQGRPPQPRRTPEGLSAFVRSANEDDDGYDPYSDRPPAPSPLFERDPWR